MKKAYENPRMMVEQFEANEYIAACGDSGVVYKFKCTAGGGKSGNVYIDSNGNGKLDREDQSLGGYHACQASHEAATTDDFLNGFYVHTEKQDPENFWDYILGNYQTVVDPVVIWRGENSDNTHCTEILDKNQWETAKS